MCFDEMFQRSLSDTSRLAPNPPKCKACKGNGIEMQVHRPNGKLGGHVEIAAPCRACEGRGFYYPKATRTIGG